MTMSDWETRLNGFLQLFDREVLQDAGRVSAELAKQHAESEFEKYRIVQDRLHKSDFDHFLESLELRIKNAERRRLTMTDHNPDIRWKQRYHNFSKSFRLLDDALENDIEDFNDLETMGVIKLLKCPSSSHGRR